MKANIPNKGQLNPKLKVHICRLTCSGINLSGLVLCELLGSGDIGCRDAFFLENPNSPRLVVLIATKKYKKQP